MADNREMYIECKNLKLGYGTNVVAGDISFRVDKGDYLCIVGENGAGKSTLMKTILKLNKPVGRRDTLRRGSGNGRYRIFASADSDTEGFSGIGI